jgi:L-lactate dehydrogenase (cytochrome)
MTEFTCIEDLRQVARRRVPRMFYDYVDTGSWTEYTYRANEAAFQRLEFRQRVAVDITERSTATRMVGQAVSMPLAIAPTGLTGMVHPDGEILAAKAAQKAGVPFTHVDHEHFLHRSRRAGHQLPPVLVSTVCDA